MKTQLAAIALLVALSAGAGGVWYVMDLRADKAALTAENSRLQREAMVAEQQAEQARLARDVERAAVRRLQADAKEFQAIREWSRSNDESIPIPDSLRPVLDKLFRREPR